MKVDKSSWVIVPFTKCVHTIKVKDAVQKKDYKTAGLYPIVSQEKEFISGFCNSEEHLNTDLGELIVFGDHTRILKFINFDFCVGADGVKVLRPVGNLYAKFLYYYLLWTKIPSNGYSRHFKFLKKLEVPYPPINEQYNIASELDALQEVINGYKAQISDLDALAQSIFLDTFGDPITNPKSWNTKRLSDVCLLTPSSELNESIVWSLSLEQIESQTGIITEYVTINKDDLGTSTFPFDEEMVLYSKLRPYLNKVVLPKYKGYATTELVPLTPDTSCLNRIFLAYLLRSKTVVSTLNCKTGGARMPRTNMNYFRSFPIILPPNELQKQFALQVETIEQQKDLLSQQLADAEMLMAERMQYYFS